MKKRLSFKKIAFVIPLIIVISFGTVTLAKYVISEFHSYYLNAKNFYFTSNRLKKNGATYLVNNWSGVGSFSISFDLMSVKNSLVYADYDIPYTVSFDCPNDVTCTLDKPTGVVYKDSLTHSDTVTLTVNPNRNYRENERLEIYVVASSTSPYVETIDASFQYVVGKQGVTYEIEDETNRPYALLKITNAINYCTVKVAFGEYSVNDLISSNVYRQLSSSDQQKCVGEEVTLNFNPNVLILDTTSNIVNEAVVGNTDINGVSYVNSLKFYVEPVSTKIVKFYKINVSNNYTYPYNNNSCIVQVSFSN